MATPGICAHRGRGDFTVANDSELLAGRGFGQTRHTNSLAGGG